MVIVAGKGYAAKNGAVGVIKETRNTRRFFLSVSQIHCYYISLISSVINLIMVIIYIILKKTRSFTAKKKRRRENNTRKKNGLQCLRSKKEKKKNNESAIITNYNTVFSLCHS